MYTHLVILRCILYAGGRSGSGTAFGVYHSLKRIGGRGSELSPYEVALMKVVEPFRLMPGAGLRVTSTAGSGAHLVGCGCGQTHAQWASHAARRQ